MSSHTAPPAAIKPPATRATLPHVVKRSPESRRLAVSVPVVAFSAWACFAVHEQQQDAAGSGDSHTSSPKWSRPTGSTRRLHSAVGPASSLAESARTGCGIQSRRDPGTVGARVRYTSNSWIAARRLPRASSRSARNRAYHRLLPYDDSRCAVVASRALILPTTNLAWADSGAFSRNARYELTGVGVSARTILGSRNVVEPAWICSKAVCLTQQTDGRLQLTATIGFGGGPNQLAELLGVPLRLGPGQAGRAEKSEKHCDGEERVLELCPI